MQRIHLNTLRMMLRQPDPVSLRVMKADGGIMELDGCIGLRENRYAGTRHVKMLASGQIRQIRDCLILSVNGSPVYL